MTKNKAEKIVKKSETPSRISRKKGISSSFKIPNISNIGTSVQKQTRFELSETAYGNFKKYV